MRWPRTGANDTVIDVLWPFVFIAIAGWLATDIWRWLGVLLGNRIAQDSAWLIWVDPSRSPWSRQWWRG